MILFRRGSQIHSIGTDLEIDVTFDLGPQPGRHRRECLAPWRPPIEVFETHGELVVRAEIGGLSRGEVQVLIEGDGLTIRGQRNVARAPERLYHESRVRYGPFEASVRLPFPVDVERAVADYVDGFLSVTLPRLSATRVTTRDERGAVGAPRGDE